MGDIGMSFWERCGAATGVLMMVLYFVACVQPPGVESDDCIPREAVLKDVQFEGNGFTAGLHPILYFEDGTVKLYGRVGSGDWRIGWTYKVGCK